VLAKKGDDLRIDWGYLYLAAGSKVATGTLKAGTEASVEGHSALATLNFADFKVGSKPVSRWLMLAYDDEYSIQYMKKNLRPYWRRNGWEAADLLKAAAKDYASLQKTLRQVR